VLLPISYSVPRGGVTPAYGKSRSARRTIPEILHPVANDRNHHQTLNLTDILDAKPFFKIGEVANIIGVKPHVLRYWESEFPSLRPKKNPSGQRIYAKADIETIVEIKNLLYNERYTILGAKQMLARQNESFPTERLRHDATITQALVRLKTYIHDLLTLLD
jgi:DNA-binding transcriptional MerR regulator